MDPYFIHADWDRRFDAQFHEFIDGQWGDLEKWTARLKLPHSTSGKFVRGCANYYGVEPDVVSPSFEENRAPVESGIPVTTGFCRKWVNEHDDGEPRALVFIMPYVKGRVQDLTEFLTSVDKVESRAGLDLFHFPSDSVETSMEQRVSTELWALPVPPN